MQTRVARPRAPDSPVQGSNLSEPKRREKKALQQGAFCIGFELNINIIAENNVELLRIVDPQWAIRIIEKQLKYEIGSETPQVDPAPSPVWNRLLVRQKSIGGPGNGGVHWASMIGT